MSFQETKYREKGREKERENRAYTDWNSFVECCLSVSQWAGFCRQTDRFGHLTDSQVASLSPHQDHISFPSSPICLDMFVFTSPLTCLLKPSFSVK